MSKDHQLNNASFLAERSTMAKRTVKQRVDEFVQKKPKNVTLSAVEMDEIWQIGSTFDIIKYAFYFGYLKGQKAKKCDVKKI